MFSDQIFCRFVIFSFAICIYFVFFFPSFFSNTCLTEPRFNSGQFLCRHNDIPYQIRMKYKNRFENLTFDTDESGWHTDIPRLRKGKVGSQVILKCYLNTASVWLGFREKLPYLEPKLSFLFLPGRLGSDGIWLQWHIKNQTRANQQMTSLYTEDGRGNELSLCADRICIQNGACGLLWTKESYCFRMVLLVVFGMFNFIA